MHITGFRPRSATPDEVAAYAAVQLAALAADDPGEPLPARDWLTARLTRAPSPDVRRLYWVARDAPDGPLTAVASLMLAGELDSDLAAVNIAVRPEQRRRGTGTALLRTAAAAGGSRHCLFAEGIRPGTPGAAFADFHQFAVVQHTLQLSLDLAAVSQASWDLPDPAGYRLVQWTGSAPEGLLSSYAAARNAIYEAPQGSMSFTEPEWSPARVRAEEATARDRACELWVAVAVHEQTGAVAGLTFLEVFAQEPELGRQQDTAVLAAHRGHGLGAWLKAANLRRLTAARPAVREVRTSNAADNEHMLRVNRQVGFTVTASAQNREAALADLRARLG
jgi:mycothiol synthase